VPVFPGTKELAEAGMVPGGLGRNRDFRGPMVDMGDGVPAYLADILFDPQTSGGLLMAVPHEKAWMLLEKLHAAGAAEAAIIGEVVAEPAGRIRVE
jgi:selenide,water dikinase